MTTPHPEAPAEGPDVDDPSIEPESAPDEEDEPTEPLGLA